MAIPDYLAAVKAAKAKYPEAWSHAHVDGDPQRWDFIKLLANDLHATDPKIGLNGKRGNPNDLSMDALNYLCEASDSAGRTPEGLPCAVIDCIGSAGIPSAYPVWNPFTTLVEGSGAYVTPGPVVPPQPPQPTYPPYPGDEVWDAMGVVLFADYARAHVLRPNDPNTLPNPGMSRWFGRVEYDWLVKNVPTLQASIDKQRPNWCAALGIPVA